MNKKFAFTLSELLIAMGIIGVISALTVPTMINNYQKNANAIQFRKVLTEIAAAADMYTMEEGKQYFDQTRVMQDSDARIRFFNEKFKIIRTCPSDTNGGCFSSNPYRASDASLTESFTCSREHYLLANSAAICPIGDYNGSHATNHLVLYIDINGPDAPNTGGRDMFKVYIDGFGEIQPNIPSKTADLADDCPSSPLGAGCYKRLLENNWKMDY